MVRNFKESVWLRHRHDIIKRGNIAKFTQNGQSKECILSTSC